MTKLQITIKQDVLSKHGRELGILWSTDDDNVNSILKAPRSWHRRYPANVTLKLVKADFLAEAVPLIEKAIEANKGSLIGKTFEVTI